MDLGLKGKRAIVTGATSGLGLACAEALAAEGVDLVLFARGAEGLEAAAVRLREVGAPAVMSVRGDMTKRPDLRRLRDAVAAVGGFDILVLNTPRPPSPMHDLLEEDDDERWEEAHRRQLQGPLIALRDLAPLLQERRWGRIVAITSASVKQPMARHALSTVYRAGLQAALKHLVTELGPSGVTVNAVAPATVMTPTFTAFHDLEARVQATALKRYGRPEEVAAAVAFLASERAGFITGELLQLDGGQTASLL